MKKSLLVGLAVVIAASARAAEVALVPTNVTVQCAAGTLALAPSGGRWTAGGVEVEFAEDGRLLLKAPRTSVSRLSVLFRANWPSDAGVRVYRDAWERTGGRRGLVSGAETARHGLPLVHARQAG